MTKKALSSTSTKSKKQSYILKLQNNTTLQINSNFQNGNIRFVKRISTYEFLLQCVNDNEPSSQKKALFYFKIKGSAQTAVRLYVRNVSIYDYLGSENVKQVPYYKEGFFGKWKPYDFCSFTKLNINLNQQIDVMAIDYTFKNQFATYFCITVPFTYTDNEIYLEGIRQNIHQNIQYEDKIVAKTKDGLNIHCISITEGGKQDSKPIVLITARVHPGQVSSSYCLQGILNFLLQPFNIQSYLLRRLFQFKIFPMLNPEGIVEGNYRMDTKGNNLNRHYEKPSNIDHPAIYSVVELIKQIQSNNGKLQFYFDLHSHSNNKEAFIYGNAFEDVVEQVYSELFCKVLESNYGLFRYGLCNFDEKQMRAKDKGQFFSKQGCGRVVLQKTCNLIKSYTVQSSMFPFYYDSNSTPLNEPTATSTYTINNQLYTHQQTSSTPDSTPLIITQNQKLGKSLLISILDIYSKNPESTLSKQLYIKHIKQLYCKLITYDRFKSNTIKTHYKSAQIINLIKSNYQSTILDLWNSDPTLIQTINQIHHPNFIHLQPTANASITMGNHIMQSANRLSIVSKSNNKSIVNYKITTKNHRDSKRNSSNKDQRRIKTQYGPFSNKFSDVKTSQLKFNTMNNYYPEIKYSFELNKQAQNKKKQEQKQRQKERSQPKFLLNNPLIKQRLQTWGRKNTPKHLVLNKYKTVKNNLILLKYIHHYRLKPSRQSSSTSGPQAASLLRITPAKNPSGNNINPNNNPANTQRQQQAQQQTPAIILQEKMQKYIDSLQQHHNSHYKRSYKLPYNSHSHNHQNKNEQLHTSDQMANHNNSYINVSFDVGAENKQKMNTSHYSLKKQQQ